MAFYDLREPRYRAQFKANHEAEKAAAENGTWPRDINDQMRWINLPRMPYDPAPVVLKAHREYVVRMCQSAIDYINDLERRILSGDNELAGYQK